MRREHEIQTVPQSERNSLLNGNCFASVSISGHDDAAECAISKLFYHSVTIHNAITTSTNLLSLSPQPLLQTNSSMNDNYTNGTSINKQQ